MSQSRKFRRAYKSAAAARGKPLPPEWPQVEAAERARVNEAMKAVQQMLPDRGLILMAIPNGTSTQDVQAMACVHNLTDRSQVASVFEAMLEWWSPEIITAQPDRAAVGALREGVAAVSQIPIPEVARQLGETTMRLLQTIAKREHGTAPQLVQDALMLATIGLSIFGHFQAPVQHHAPGGSADGSGAPAPAPLPPRRQWPRGNTKETLVADLLERPQSEHRDQIIEMARAGKFHDYEAEIPNPKALLIDVLARFGFPDLAGKARDGGYDGDGQTLEQAEELRAEVGAERYDSMIGGKPRGTA